MFCQNPRRGVAWLHSDGSLWFVRCGASNRCDYCAMIAAVENAVVLRLDAYDGDRPTVGITTTTRRRDYSMGELRAAEAQLWRTLRARFGRVEYCGFVEWTRGVSDGVRRPHVHHTVKGVPAEEAAAVEPEVSELWRRFSGDAWRVECRPLRTPMGAIAYLVLHHHKREQGPPPGTKHTKRFRPSRGYFTHPVGELRREARELLRDERLYASVVEGLGFAGGAVPEALLDELVGERIDAARRRARFSAPELVHVREVPHVDRCTGEVSYEFRGVLGRRPR